MAAVRLAFLGSPEAAVPPLRALVAGGHDVALAVTQPDRRRGRGGALAPTPVKEAAAGLGIPVTHRVDDVLGAGVELGVVVAFGKLIKPHVLAEVPMLNVHFSLLPRWRGAAPVERAILAGDTETGVCLMALEEGLDTGPVYRSERVAIATGETAAELRARLVEIGTAMLVELLQGPLPEPAPQKGEPTYARKIDPAELELDWSRPAAELERVVRVGGAWTAFRGRRLLVHRAAAAPAGPEVAGLAPGEVAGARVRTGEGVLVLGEVQSEGKARQPADAWARGARAAPGERLGA